MTIAITGATGFLGLRLLTLLLRHDEPVVVLAHAGTAPAHERIMGYLNTSGQPEDVLHAARARMTVLCCDVGRPRLGLPEWQFHALGERLTAIWHAAANTNLDGPAIIAPRWLADDPLDDISRRAHRINVDGTRRVLELAAAGEPAVYHVSTAFVAGRCRTGTILESDLDPSYGFENPYEESKFLAEHQVRDWSARHHRPVTVFRPSILISDVPARPSDASHTLAKLATLADFMRVDLPSAGHRSTERPTIRIVGRADAHLNLMPVESAARLMVDMAHRLTGPGVRTVHITYPCEVRYPALFELIEERCPVRLVLIPSFLDKPSRLEAVLSEHLRGLAPYAFHHRYYHRAALGAAGLAGSAQPLGPDYLRAVLTPPMPSGPHRAGGSP